MRPVVQPNQTESQRGVIDAALDRPVPRESNPMLSDANRLKLAVKAGGRQAGVFAGGYIVCADTEAEAWRRYRYVVRDQLDVASTSEFVELWSRQSGGADVIPLQDRVDRMAAGFNALPLVGTAEQIVERMHQMSDGGLAGLAISFDDYDEGIAAYDEAIRPLLIQTRLRSV
jgi:alkanesulfonate monooxygenase SsuD/methylene tetrahydromethanopterin reductase-like flavin-dependent oxidoreductase (luciferase family)